MTSILPGYLYDIFISYRQKDNKQDGWVTEFVRQLKGELESTFKEDISVYFDINPQNGLLGTHEVGDSLKPKLKCLVFMPVISRTYCDPNSFAWKHEFKAFVEMAAKDPIGLKVKLPDGNVASRVLPIRIHDLDPADIKECESILGGVLRGVEFIYKEPGVNRPLTYSDNPENNLIHANYRNQINKVALAIKEMVGGLQGAVSETSFKPKELAPSIEKNAYPERSIIVLPFENMSTDPDQEYFSDGLTEEIINVLAHIEDLLVVARTSAFAFKGKNMDIREIGRQLNVQYALEGSVRKSSNRLRITAQLIKVEDGFHVWSERYDRQLDDVFDIQDEISKTIVEKLKINLLLEEKTRIEKRHTENLEAYNLYLQGRYSMKKRSEKGLRKALGYFQKAARADPQYALAYAGIADSYVVLSGYDIIPPREGFPKAKENIIKALTIDPLLPEALATLGVITWENDFNGVAAEKLYRYSIQLNSGESQTHCQLGELLGALGRHDEAIREFKQALRLDPYSIVNRMQLGSGYFLARQYDDCIRECEKTLEMESDFLPCLSVQGDAYLKTGNFEKATAIFEKVLKLSKGDSMYQARLAYCYAVSGEKPKARQILADLQNRRNEYVSPYSLALVYAGLDEKKMAVDYLEKSFEHHNFRTLSIMEDARFDNLRSEPRFKELIRKIRM